MKLKKILAMILACTMVLPVGAAPAMAEDTTELRVRAQSWLYGKYDFDEAKADFEENHPGVTVTYLEMDNTDYTSNLLDWANGTTTCDIAIGGDRSNNVAYLAQDLVVEFDEDNFFNGDFTKDKFYEVFLENGAINGRQFMIPLLGESVGLVCNKEMFAEAGYVDEDGEIIAPTTWDEMLEYAKNMTTDNQKGLGIDWGSNMMLFVYEACIQGLTGSLYTDDGVTLNFSGDDIKGMLEIWKTLVDEGYTGTDVFNDADANRTAFKSGTLAMHVAPASRWIEASAEDVLGEDAVALAAVPGTDTNGSINYIHGMMIPKISENQDLAIEFIKEEMLKESFQAGALNTYGKMSPMKSDYEDLENPYWPVCISFTENAATPALYKDGPSIDLDIQTEFQNYINGKNDVDTFLANMTEKLNTYDLTTGVD